MRQHPWEYWTTDKVHPTPAGHTVIAQVITEYLEVEELS